MRQRLLRLIPERRRRMFGSAVESLSAHRQMHLLRREKGLLVLSRLLVFIPSTMGGCID